MAAIRQLHYSTDYTWGSGTGGTWTQITDFLEEDLEPGQESPIGVRMGEGGEEQDGVELQGSALITGSNIPTAGTRYFIKVKTVGGTEEVRGGANGCRVRTGKSGIRPLGGGPAYTRLEFSCTGNARGSLIEDYS